MRVATFTLPLAIYAMSFTACSKPKDHAELERAKLGLEAAQIRHDQLELIEGYRRHMSELSGQAELGACNGFTDLQAKMGCAEARDEQARLLAMSLANKREALRWRITNAKLRCDAFYRDSTLTASGSARTLPRDAACLAIERMHSEMAGFKFSEGTAYSYRRR